MNASTSSEPNEYSDAQIDEFVSSALDELDGGGLARGMDPGEDWRKTPGKAWRVQGGILTLLAFLGGMTVTEGLRYATDTSSFGTPDITHRCSVMSRVSDPNPNMPKAELSIITDEALPMPAPR